MFIVARSAIQIASVAYRVIEKEMDARTATRQTTLLSLAILAALIVTSVVAGYAILVMFATLDHCRPALTRMSQLCPEVRSNGSRRGRQRGGLRLRRWCA